MSKVLCLVNSPKEQARCIAGLDLETGRLVRPVSETASQAIPKDWAMVDGDPVEPLDVVDIPFVRGDAVVPYQSENRYCTGKWRRIRRMPPAAARRYCESDAKILNTQESDAVPERALRLSRLGRAGWKSLQLIHVKRIDFRKSSDGKWTAEFGTCNGRRYELRVTDQHFTEQLQGNTSSRGSCLLLLSLTRPWRHYRAPKTKPKKCYKLFAGVMPL